MTITLSILELILIFSLFASTIFITYLMVNMKNGKDVATSLLSNNNLPPVIKSL